MPAPEPKLAKDFAADAAVVCCAFDATGQFAFAGCEDGRVRRFRIADGAKTVFAARESWVFALAASGPAMVSASGDGNLCWWSAAGAADQTPRVVAAHDGWARCLAASPDGQWFASGGNDRRVRLWSAAGQPVRAFVGHDARVFSLLFHPDGKRLYSADLTAKVREWDLATGKELALFHPKELHHPNVGQNAEFGGVRGLALSPDRKRLAFAGLHRAPNPFAHVCEPLALEFDAAAHKPLKSYATTGLQAAAWQCHYLPDGTLLVGAGGQGGGALLFFKPGEEKEFKRFMLPNMARYTALAPDGKSVLSAHHDKKLRLTTL